MFKLYKIEKPEETRFFKIMKETKDFVSVKEVKMNEEGVFEFVGKQIRRKEFSFGIEISKNNWAVRITK